LLLADLFLICQIGSLVVIVAKVLPQSFIQNHLLSTTLHTLNLPTLHFRPEDKKHLQIRQIILGKASRNELQVVLHDCRLRAKELSQ
jgi:hypothetical protein